MKQLVGVVFFLLLVVIGSTIAYEGGIWKPFTPAPPSETNTKPYATVLGIVVIVVMLRLLPAFGRAGVRKTKDRLKSQE